MRTRAKRKFYVHDVVKLSGKGKEELRRVLKGGDYTVEKAGLCIGPGNEILSWVIENKINEERQDVSADYLVLVNRPKPSRPQT